MKGYIHTYVHVHRYIHIYTQIYIYIYVCMYVYIWRMKWQPNPVFFPGKSHGQRSLERGRGAGAGYSSWGRKELD